MPSQKVCILSLEDEKRIIFDKIEPNCREHDHKSHKFAREWAAATHGRVCPEIRETRQMGSNVSVLEKVYRQRPSARIEFYYNRPRLIIEHCLAPAPKESYGYLVMQWGGAAPVNGGRQEPRTLKPGPVRIVMESGQFVAESPQVNQL
jgi:hypothetical protein